MKGDRTETAASSRQSEDPIGVQIKVHPEGVVTTAHGAVAEDPQDGVENVISRNVARRPVQALDDSPVEIQAKGEWPEQRISNRTIVNRLDAEEEG